MRAQGGTASNLPVVPTLGAERLPTPSAAVLLDAREELLQLFDVNVGITGKAELAELDGPVVRLRLSGRFWCVFSVTGADLRPRAIRTDRLRVLQAPAQPRGSPRRRLFATAHP